MLRRDFLRRMIFAGLATWFLDLPLPREPEPEGYIFQYRAVGSDHWINHHPAQYPSGGMLVIDTPGLANGTHYEIRVVPA